jgi:E3 ubiquitin-protein ligase BAH
VNATLSPDTRVFLEDIVATQKGYPPRHNVVEQSHQDQDCFEKYGPDVRRVEVNLTFDAEFFDLLQGNVSNLDRLQAGEQLAITNEIGGLSKELTAIARPPSRFYNKTDMCQWREL